MRTVYVNGCYLPEDKAQISVFDRGFLFADAVYEVTAVLDGKLIDWQGHITRLKRSLGELGIPVPMSDEAFLDVHREIAERNTLEFGRIYLQVSRGVADRDFTWNEGMSATVVLFTQSVNSLESPALKNGIKIISRPDIRWGRCDIKTVQLLAPCLLKMEAKAAGKDDVWMIKDGFVTEGSSNNSHIITQDGTLVTRPADTDILAGVTRASLLSYVEEEGMKIDFRPFTIAEAQAALEVFVTSATTFVTSVIEIDDIPVANGKPGPHAGKLRDVYLRESRARAI